MKKKPFYKLKKFWIGVITAIGIIAALSGMPQVQPFIAPLTAVIGAIMPDDDAPDVVAETPVADEVTVIPRDDDTDADNYMREKSR